jgi:oxalate decarboxylase/phosphoglucose isomerase-like protein (cupin superfamily)
MKTANEAVTALPGTDRDPEIIALRTQLASKGHTKHLLAQTDMMTMHIHCYAPKGGENGLHTHVKEDHVFVCLQGEAVFSGLHGALPALKKHQAIFIPRGCFYSFSNETEEPCILLRFGASADGHHGERIDPQGKPIAGRAHKAGAIAPVLIEGAFFE